MGNSLRFSSFFHPALSENPLLSMWLKLSANSGIWGVAAIKATFIPQLFAMGLSLAHVLPANSKWLAIMGNLILPTRPYSEGLSDLLVEA